MSVEEQIKQTEKDIREAEKNGFSKKVIKLLKNRKANLEDKKKNLEALFN